MTTGALSCPVCRIPLTQLSADDSAIFLPVCMQCGGTWLDLVRSQRVVRGLVTESERALADHASKHGTPATAGGSYRQAPTHDAGARFCADCAAPLTAVVVKEAGVTLDACHSHGTWFDATELATVAEAFAPRTAGHEGSSVARMVTGLLR
jgi:Zn-finger nucleic acid-binding protein